MALTAARLPARQDAQGGALLLHEQDRSKWDSHLLGLGYFHLDRCAAGKVVSPYHLEAGIAAAHARAASVAATDWPEIALLYERLSRACPSPVVALNHAVAVAHVQGPHKAIQMLKPLLADKRLENYHLLPAVIAHMHALAGEWLAAAMWYQKALDGVSTDPQRALLQERLRQAKAQAAQL